MPTVNNHKDAEAINKKALELFKRIKKVGDYICHTDFYPEARGTYTILAETNIPQHVGDALRDIVEKSERAIFMHITIHEGRFDWAANTYIKDAVSVTFKF